MFGRLMDFEEKNFWEQTGGEIIIDLPQETRRYTIFSVEYVNPDEKDVYTIGFVPGEEFEQFVNRLIARSLYEIPVTVAKNSRILTLSTCAEDGRIRFVVHAVQTEGPEV